MGAVAASSRTKSRRKKSTGVSPRERRRRSRARVIAASLRLAEDGSFRDVTVDEIARTAGISRSAFYTHFEDKQGLLLVAVAEVAEQLFEMAERWWRDVGSPADRVRRAIEGVVSVYAENAALLRLATEVSTYDDEMRALWLDIGERFIAATAQHIHAEQRGGLIPESLEPRATAEGLFWMTERCSYIYLGRRDRKPDEVIEGLVPVWIAALYPGVIPAGAPTPG